MLYDASEQVSSGSQALAQGTSEQEASIRELSDYVQDISGKVNKNAENAKNVSEISDTATTDLKEGNAEMQKMLAAMKEEKHYSFNFEKLQPEYIPTVGDVVIVWDDNSKENAVVGVMNEMDKTVRPYKINDGTWYGNCDKFVSEEQYKNLIDGKE